MFERHGKVKKQTNEKNTKKGKQHKIFGFFFKLHRKKIGRS